MRALLASDDPHAAEAVGLFVSCAVKGIAAMASSLAALECLVITAGIEHAPTIRWRICERLHWLGAEIDAAANGEALPTINTTASRIEVFVMPTSEETTSAWHCQAVLALQ